MSGFQNDVIGVSEQDYQNIVSQYQDDVDRAVAALQENRFTVDGYDIPSFPNNESSTEDGSFTADNGTFSAESLQKQYESIAGLLFDTPEDMLQAYFDPDHENLLDGDNPVLATITFAENEYVPFNDRISGEPVVQYRLDEGGDSYFEVSADIPIKYDSTKDYLSQLGTALEETGRPVTLPEAVETGASCSISAGDTVSGAAQNDAAADD